ncbi:septal ring lytic transglycosylase RlpA family protein [Methylobacterium sp. E-005]|uniref:septal ring lytic transglycosylase RlpA family protein n=1 Tax=Methylobacterium sp. E-005 TaxID=2836549 RepID=UPI001FB8942B|nr:septal ring lytic transglycosylase RlpA family protein [Methylobacterium sp. E-005]MCJ2087905.1 septal ring lytic transglycosylase RlpA family protein [Methylobacterium sp. E-005]
MVRTTLPRPARLALRLLAVSGVALATANCATQPQQRLSAGNGVDPKYGVKASPRLYNEGDVIPKGGGRRYTGKPYVVAGQTYVPKEDPRGYVREGLASWYGSAFHGRMTANGEVFDRHSIAAAHPTLPLPSYARVTNLDNGYSMVVRVNDRGPYHAGRVMDVSEEAADALGFHRKGTAHVRVEYVGKASVAGSDDRKLLASLRTDGRPAGRSAVMVADLGPAAETERYERATPAPLAFKPAQDRVQEPVQDRVQEPLPEPAQAREEPAPAPRPAPIRAPIVLASAAVTVPAAVQPTAQRVREFHPMPVAAQGASLKVAGLNPAALAPPSTGHGGALKPAASGRVAVAEAAHHPGSAPGRAGAHEPTRLAQGGAAMPVPAKLAMARLASAAPARDVSAKGPAARIMPFKVAAAPRASALHAAAPAKAAVKTASAPVAPAKITFAKAAPVKSVAAKGATTQAAAKARPSRMAGIY